MRTLILLIFPLALSAGETSNIHGSIVDPSGRSVEGAQVSCANQTAYSNFEGRFTISGVDSCDAAISKTGFTTQTIHLTAQSPTKIALVIAGPVETMVVTATRTEMTPEQATVAANVISEQRVSTLDFPPVFDALRDIPGLQVSQYGPTGSLVSLYTRGSESTGTLVMVDGVPLNDPGGEIHLEHLTTQDIDRVEVVRGPQSALFGAEAAAGVVQIFTKHGDPEDVMPHATVSYERGSFQTDRWMANLAGGDGNRFDYALSASELHTVGEFQNQYDRDNTGTSNLGYRFSDATQLRAVFRIYDDHVGVPGQVAYGIDDPVPSEETRNETVSLRLDDSRGLNFTQQFSFSFNRLSDRYNDDEPYSMQPLAALVRNVGGPVPEVYFVQLLNPNSLPNQIPPGLSLVTTDAYFGPSDSLNKTERKIAGYQGSLSHHGGVLTFGYQYQDQSGFLSGNNASRTNNGFFANFQQSFGDRIYLSGGARLEHSSAFGNIGSGRAGASFLLAKEHGALSSAFFRVSGGRGVTEPSLLENYAENPYYHGNPALKPEETTTFEAALAADWFHRRIRTEVTAFRNSFHNLIAFVTDSWQNVEQSWARGVETSVQARLPHNLLIMSSYMFLDTRITNSASPESSTTGIGEQLVHRPRNSGSVSLALTPRRWSFVAGGRFAGEFQDSDFTFGVTRNPGYNVVYAAATYQATKHITPVLRVDNVLNARYEEVLGYQALPRNIIGGVRLNW